MFKKGYVQSEEHKEKIRKAVTERWARKHAQKDPETLGDTSCSLCVEFAEPEDFKALKPNCRNGEDCIIRVIWARFLLKFTRRKP